MTQEDKRYLQDKLCHERDKELLLKDLCARLPYGVRCKYYNVYKNCYEEGTISGFERKEYIEIGGECVNVEEIKPYLFPLSSMTEEQRDYLHKNPNGIYIQLFDNTVISASNEGFDWLNKHHFDYRGLIEKGLAIDATGTSVYQFILIEE